MPQPLREPAAGRLRGTGRYPPFRPGGLHIPDPPAGTALAFEDPVAIADGVLWGERAGDYSDLWRRVGARRAFMASALGFRLSPDVLLFSFADGDQPPFWLDDALVCTLAG